LLEAGEDFQSGIRDGRMDGLIIVTIIQTIEEGAPVLASAAPSPLEELPAVGHAAATER